jgi:hypothetical protein
MLPNSKIENIYKEPLKEEDIVTNYQVGKDIILQSDDVMADLKTAIDRKRNDMNLGDIVPISLPEDKALELKDAIWSDVKWLDSYDSLLKLLLPDLKIDPVSSARDLFIPWWNSPQLGLISDKYTSIKDINKTVNDLEINAFYSHSYIDLLVRTGKYPDIKLDPCLVIGVLISNDGHLILGMRGGQSFGDTFQAVPAGSAEPHSGKNPIFESFYDKELPEETGLTKDDLLMDESGLVGRAIDYSLQKKQKQRSYYVFRTVSKLDLEKVIEKWDNSEDKREHKGFVSFSSHPEKFLPVLKYRGYDYDMAIDYSEKNNLQLSVTAPANIGTILPPAIISIMTDYVQKFGDDFAKKSQEYLNNHYDLTSCFEK